MRGKAGCPVEFGAKVTISLVGGYAFVLKAEWNSYAESKSLKQALAEYKRIFGFYPKTILADRAYPSRKTDFGVRHWASAYPGPDLGGNPPRKSPPRANKSIRMAVNMLRSRGNLALSSAGMVWIE